MAAVLLYFRHDLWRIARAWLVSLRDPVVRKTLDARMGWYIVLGTIPIGICGLAFSDQIESGARDLYLIGTTLIVLGLLLLAAEQVAKRDRSLEDIKRRDGIVIGLAQAAALVPGVSRSGATITAGLFLGFDRESAARYSFLLSVPAVVLSGLFELRKIGDEGGAGFGPTLLATLAAFVVGYASIAFLLRWLARHSTLVFVVYRVVLGALVITLAASGVIA
jgi:undecaprenyl-diphosphatase